MALAPEGREQGRRGLFLLSVLMLCGRVIGGEVSVALELKQPLDWQVWQRQKATEGIVRLSGRRADGAIVEWKMSGKPAAGALNEAWQALPVESGKSDFAAEILVPAGGWYRLEVRAARDGKTLGESTVEHVGVGEVFVVAGQSNSANYGSAKQQTKTKMVTCFDGRSWRIADDPQRGAGGKGGSFMPAFGDVLYEKFKVPVAVVPLGIGSTSVREWLPKGEKVERLTTTGKGLKQIAPGQWESMGGAFATLSQRLATLGTRGCRAILWHQGESDAGQARGGYPAERQISGADYARYMTILVSASRKAAGWDVPWFSAQVTYHSESDPADDEFRAAQKGLWASKLTMEGPDTDALRKDFRAGVHFNEKGLQKHGELWAEKVGAWLEVELKKKE